MNALLFVIAFRLLSMVSLAILLFLLSFLRRTPIDQPPHSTWLLSRRWAWWDAGILGTVLLLCNGVGGVTLGMLLDANPADRAATEAVWLPLIQGVGAGVGVGVLAVLLSVKRVSWRSAFGAGHMSLAGQLGLGLLLSVAVLPVMWNVGFLVSQFFEAIDVPAQEQHIMELIGRPGYSGGYYVVWLVVAGVLAPVAEELLFRGVLFPLIARRARVGFAIAFVSVLFAYMHFNVEAFLPLFVLSVALCASYLYSGSLLVPIVIHAANNILTVSILVLGRG